MSIPVTDFMRALSVVKTPLVFVLGGLVLLSALCTPVSIAHAQATPDTPAPTSQPTETANGSGEDSGSLDLGSITLGAVLSPVALVSYAVFSLAKGILWLSGIVFNFSVAYLVFEFAKHLGTTSGMLLGWSLLRDLGNIMLLFSFIWIGIRMILNVSHFSAGKTLAQLVLFATLLNFSLFISAAIVDGSNGLTLALFSQNVGYKCDESMEKCLNDGVAGQILQQVNILSVVGGSGQEMNLESQVTSYLDKPLESILQFLLLSIIVSVAAAVLLAGGLLIVTRGITLAFLLVTSPIGFAGMAFEPLHEMSEKWWKALINNALFAPVFLVLLFLGLRLTDGLATLLGTEGGFAGALAGGGSLDAGPIFLFVLVIGFMIAALTVGKKFGIAGADFAIKTATQTAGIPFIMPRDLVGRGAGWAGKAYDRRVAGAIRNPLPFLDRYGFAGKLANSVVKGVGGAVDGNIRETLSAGKNVVAPGWGSYADWEKGDKERKEHIEHAEHALHFQQDLDAAIKSGNSDEIEKIASTASIAELKDTKQLKDGASGVEQLARSMTASKFKQIDGDKDVDEKVKAKMRKARFGTLNNDLASALNPASTPQQRAQFRQWSTTDIETSGILNDASKREDLARALSDKQFDSLMGSDGVGRGIKQSLRELREGTGPGARFSVAHAKSTLRSMDAADIAKLKGGVLTSPQVLENLDGSALATLVRSNKSLSAGEKQALKDHVLHVYGNPNPATTEEREQQLEIEDYLSTVQGTTDEVKFRNYYGMP
jgi:hypothetical protein